MKKAIIFACTAALILGLFVSCGQTQEQEPALEPLPPAEADEDSAFGIDKHINQGTIDNWLGRDDVAYRDVRMLFDPADYGSIGGEADLTATIEGFTIVPYPYIGTLQSLPVANAYEGDKLFEIVWDTEKDYHIASVTPLYEESMMILEELFPKDKAIFLMCGGGGYSQMMKNLLLYLGWDETKVYNTGANWTYTGEHALELVLYPEDVNDDNTYATWRANYADIEFSKLHPVK